MLDVSVYISILHGMESFARSRIEDFPDNVRSVDEEGYSKKMVLAFLNSLKDFSSGLKPEDDFFDKLNAYSSSLHPIEEDIFFYDVAVYFYEEASEKIDAANEEEKEQIKEVIEGSKDIVAYLDDFYGYGYFDEDL